MAGSDRTKLYGETQRAALPQLAQGINHLADLSKALQEMTHNLLEQAAEAKKADVPSCRTIIPSEEQEDTGETRCLYLSPLLLEDEQDLLQECDVDTVEDILEIIYDSLSGIAMLMRHVDDGCELPGYAVKMLGENMQKSIELLMRLHCYYKEMELRHLINPQS